jgi:hypothetical protein
MGVFHQVCLAIIEHIICSDGMKMDDSWEDLRLKIPTEDDLERGVH